MFATKDHGEFSGKIEPAVESGKSENVENVSTFFPEGERIEKKRKKRMGEAEERGNEEGKEGAE